MAREKTVILNDNEIALLKEGLMTEKCLIETGCSMLTANDIESGHKGITLDGSEAKIRALSSEQMQTLLTIDTLHSKLT